MESEVTALELCAATVLNREPGRYGHILLLMGGDEDGHANHTLRATLERGLRTRWLPHLNLHTHSEVQQVAAWLYSTDLGQSERKEDSGSEDIDIDIDIGTPQSYQSYQSSPARDRLPQSARLHPRRRIGVLHNLHLASPEVQASLIGALQHNTVYGAGERKLKLLTVVATCDARHASSLLHPLKERFAIAAHVDNPCLPDSLANSVHDLLATDPASTIRKLFGDHELHPPTGVYMCTQVQRYLSQCVRRCRVNPDSTMQLPSHGIMTELQQTLKVLSVVLRGRQFVTPEDVKMCLPYLLFHRISLAATVTLAPEEEGAEEQLLLLPKMHKWVDSYWSVSSNEDMLHSVLSSMLQNGDTPALNTYNANLTVHAWTHVVSIIGKGNFLIHKTEPTATPSPLSPTRTSHQQHTTMWTEDGAFIMGGPVNCPPTSHGTEWPSVSPTTASPLRQSVTLFAAQLYGLSHKMSNGPEKTRIKQMLREIILKDPEIPPESIPKGRVILAPTAISSPAPRLREAKPKAETREEEPAPTPEQPVGTPVPTQPLHSYHLLALPQVSGKYPWKDVEKPPPPSGHVPSDGVAERLDQRWKQVMIGLLTKGHRNFMDAYSSGSHLPCLPIPPDIYLECSKREFDRNLRHWRRLLHVYDVAEDGSTTCPDLLSCLGEDDEWPTPIET